MNCAVVERCIEVNDRIQTRFSTKHALLMGVFIMVADGFGGMTTMTFYTTGMVIMLPRVS